MFQILVIMKLIHLRVIVFADYKDFEKTSKILPSPLFSRLKKDIAVKSSINSYLNTVC